jgi:hypothetical protein
MSRAYKLAWERNAYKILVGNQEGRRQLREPKCRLEDNIKISL